MSLDASIVKRQTKVCNPKHTSFVYLLPNKLCEKVLSFLEYLGPLAFDFKQTSLLKIENELFSISGIKRLKEIKLIIKKEGFDITEFENKLNEYVKLVSKNIIIR